MKIHQISNWSRVIQTKRWNYMQSLIDGRWRTVEKRPAKPRTLPQGVKLIGSA